MYIDLNGVRFTEEESSILCSIIGNKAYEEQEKAEECGRLARKWYDKGHKNLTYRLLQIGEKHIGNAHSLEKLEREIIANTWRN